MTLTAFVRQLGATLTSSLTTPFDPASSIDDSTPDPLVSCPIHELKYCRDLLNSAQQGYPATAAAWRLLELNMAIIPAGDVVLDPIFAHEDQAASSREQVRVPSFYIDRFPIRNRDYQEFVDDDGYNQSDLWPTDILPYLLQFTDTTGAAGPGGWKQGRFPNGKDDHPVTGISWFEAHAFGKWCGKILPTAAQWQWAATWSTAAIDALGYRFPWGNSFDPQRANTWISGQGDTTPVDRFPSGSTPNGVYDLIGNVWEWTADEFAESNELAQLQLLPQIPLVEIRGGAFDTYLETQSCSRFRSGQELLKRTHNTGFRCCFPADHLPPPPAPAAFLTEDLST